MDTSGNITDAYDFDAFGTLIHQTGSTSNVYLYSGEQFDPDLALYYQRARYLNAASGRFHTLDADEGFIFKPKSLHKYGYAEGNPVDGIDPTGEFVGGATEEVELLVEAEKVEEVEVGDYPAARTALRLVAAAFAIGTILVTSTGPEPEPEREPLPQPKPEPTGPTKTKEDDNNKQFVNFDTSAAEAFGMVNPDYSNHPALADIVSRVGGRQIVMTGTALAEFFNNLGAAGTVETIRSYMFLAHVTPIADNPSANVLQARARNPLGAKHDSRERDINIFGTGDQYHIETITGDGSFIQFLRSNHITLTPPAYVFKPPARFSGR